MKYAIMGLGWAASNALALAVGGYIVYRWRGVIDAGVAKAEAAFAYVYGLVKHKA